MRRLLPFVLFVALVGCRTTAVLTQATKIAEPSAALQAAIVAITEARLDDAERAATTMVAAAPGDAALIRLYLAERRHDVAAVRELSSGATGVLLRSDRWRLTALARVRYWTEGLSAAKDDLHAACVAVGTPDLGMARTNACALAAQADALGGRPANAVDAMPGETKLLPNQPVLVAAAALNGHKPTLFVIDTGAPTSVLSRKYADKAGFPYNKDVKEASSDGGGNPVALNPAVLDRLTLGNATVTQAAAHVLDLPPAFHVAGILAPQQTFPGAAIEFDLRAQVMRVLPGQSPDSWAALTGERTHSVPVLWVDGNLYIPAQIEQVRAWILLDTGADRNYACSDVAEQVGAGAALAAQAKSRSYTAGGTLEVQEGFNAHLAVGDSTPLDAHFMVKGCDRRIRWANLVPPMFGAGFLGVGWLQGRRVLLSGDGRRLVFTEPAATSAVPVPPIS